MLFVKEIDVNIVIKDFLGHRASIVNRGIGKQRNSELLTDRVWVDLVIELRLDVTPISIASMLEDLLACRAWCSLLAFTSNNFK